jgi:hypothetical protein
MRFVLSWAVLPSLAVAPAVAGPIVAPNTLAATEGNSENAVPFDIAEFGTPSLRYQLVVAANQFPAGGPLTVTQIAFRPDGVLGSAFSATLPDVRIGMSTASNGPDALRATFADNVGPDDTTVFRGPLALSSRFTGPAGGPKDFDIVINLQTPFRFDPRRGTCCSTCRTSAAAGPRSSTPRSPSATRSPGCSAT